MKNLLFVIFILPLCCFALSCPNSPKTLLYNQDIASVIQACGYPTSEKSYSREIKVYERTPSIPYQPFFISQQGLLQPMLCQQIIYTPYSTTTTTVACGQPFPNATPITRTIHTTELFYESSSPNTLIFEDNKLIGWK